MFDATPPTFQPISDDELRDVLTQAIRHSSSGGMTRAAECYLASMCARHLAERIALAGLVVMRRPREEPGQNKPMRDFFVRGL